VDRFDSIQVLRALAAALVVFTHALMNYDVKISDFEIPYDLGSDFGVKLFFAISGFIIFKSSLRLEPGAISAGHFMARRVLRIVPIYWVATLIYALKLQFVTGEGVELNALIMSLFFVPYVNPTGLVQPLLGVGWSLNYEMFFYFFFSFALFLHFKFRALFILLILGGFLLLFYDSNFNNAVFEQPYFSSYNLLATHYLLFFLVGLILAHLKETGFFRRIILPDTQTIPIIVLLVGLALIAINYAGQNQLWVELLLCTLLIAISSFSPASQAAHDKPSIVRKWIVMAGDGSYSTYLFHGFILGVTARLVAFADFDINPYIFALLMTVFCTVVGVIIYKLIEFPMTNSLNKHYKKKVSKRFIQTQQRS